MDERQQSPTSVHSARTSPNLRTSRMAQGDNCMKGKMHIQLVMHRPTTPKYGCYAAGGALAGFPSNSQLRNICPSLCVAVQLAL